MREPNIIIFTGYAFPLVTAVLTAALTLVQGWWGTKLEADRFGATGLKSCSFFYVST
jgi:hypothetical protein